MIVDCILEQINTMGRCESDYVQYSMKYRSRSANDALLLRYDACLCKISSQQAFCLFELELNTATGHELGYVQQTICGRSRLDLTSKPQWFGRDDVMM